MGDENQSGGEVKECVFEDFEARDVEVVRRFVEDAEVRGVEHQAGEDDPSLLATGEAGDRRLELFGAEEETLRP